MTLLRYLYNRRYMAPDDWIALLYLLQQNGWDVTAITIIGSGETHCAPGVQHALQLLDVANAQDIPVACGRETPLRGNHTFPAEWRAAVDAFLGISLPSTTRQAAAQSAVDVLINQIEAARDSRERLSILSLGPLTNIAELIQRRPDLVRYVQLYVMGGAIAVPGNLIAPGSPITDNSTAEWNMYIDPHAANIAFQSTMQVTLIPLDATNDVPLTMDFYNRLAANHHTPAATFVFDLLRMNLPAIETGQYVLWDAVAATIVTNREIGQASPRKIRVIEMEGTESGRTIVDRLLRHRPICVILDVNAQRSTNFLLAGLNREK